MLRKIFINDKSYDLELLEKKYGTKVLRELVNFVMAEFPIKIRTDIIELKHNLIKFYQDCACGKHHHIKRVADEYGIRRNKAHKAYLIGEKLFNNNINLTKDYLRGAVHNAAH